MVLRRSCMDSRGFTLIEILIVMGLVAIVGGFTLAISADSFRGTSFHGSRDIIVATLLRARAQAVNNICLGASCIGGMPHGVHVATDAGGRITQLTLFQGATYALADHSLDSVIDIGSNVSRAVLFLGTPDVTFTQLSGTSTTAVMRLYEGTVGAPTSTSTITIGAEGQVLWTN